MDPFTLQEFQSNVTCSICCQYFLDPVTMDCGHSFCRPCIYLSWEEGSSPHCCPECRQKSEKTNLKTNIRLQKLATAARMDRMRQVPSSLGQVCGAHSNATGVLGDLDKNLCCESVSESSKANGHGHSHSQLQFAAEESREYVSLREEMIKAQYQKMHMLLHEEEELHLQRLHSEARELLQQLQDHESRMTQHIDCVKEKYRELVEMCHKPDMELLQNVKTELERAELIRRYRPQPVDPVLTAWSISGLRQMLNNFRVANGLKKKVASRYLLLSEDLNSEIFGQHRDAASQVQREQGFVAWGAPTFRSGRHYFEVDISHSSTWIIGLCSDCSIDDPNIIINSEGAFFLYSLNCGDGHILCTSSPLLHHYVKRPVGLVGVFLDYECGMGYSFYLPLCQEEVTGTFPDAESLTIPLLPEPQILSLLSFVSTPPGCEPLTLWTRKAPHWSPVSQFSLEDLKHTGPLYCPLDLCSPVSHLFRVQVHGTL
ncbi:tripartite motif-containing protein 64-like [Ochotona princeps]|uniref:tripartite motif-containing protein 64-like n=1 Tax=Ochotona princeps TaxID=9978 RepID=UPI0027148BA7|nr:tripartite motif-containing protein 64-like [Ochotona princeps]